MSEEQSSWGTLTTWGFQDSPVGFQEREHGFLMSGENDVTVLVLAGRTHNFVFKSMGDQDME